VSTVAAPASARQALDMVRAGLGFLAAADATERDPETQTVVLRELEADEAVLTAARAWSLAAFTAGQGHCADGDYSPRAWLMHHTQVTRGAAAAHTAWARRGPGPAAGDDLPGRGRPAWRLDPRVRGDRGGGAGCAVGAGRGGGRPDA
jgi:hypothetical protein